jgi:uncharacterized protein YodC (DUF2158 family)
LLYALEEKITSVDLQPGEKVKHKSGGPIMVTEQLNNGEWICSWMHDGKHQRGNFHSVVLERYSSPPMGSASTRGIIRMR